MPIQIVRVSDTKIVISLSLSSIKNKMENNKINYNWFAIRVKSRSEKKVYADLAEQNIEAYLPLQRKLRVWSDRKKWEIGRAHV